MKKSLKIFLIVIGVIICLVLLDTMQAIVFNNNPIIGVLTKCRSKEGLFVTTYHCGNGKNITKLKNSSCHTESVCGIDLESLEQIHEEIDDKLAEYEYLNGKKYTNVASTGVDQSLNKVIITLVNNSYEEQKWFRENIYDSYYIAFQQGGPYTTSNTKIEVVKSSVQNTNKFNIYLEKDNSIIYLSSTLKEVYYYDNEKVTLKYYIKEINKSVDNSIKSLTDLMESNETLRDGGTRIYKSKDYDLTIITCNTIPENKDIFIGDYNMLFDNDLMCHR